MSTLADSSQKPRLKNLGVAEDFPIPCSQRRVRNLVILTFDVSTCNHGDLRASPNSQCHAPGHNAWFRDYYEFLNHSPEIRQGLMSWCRWHWGVWALELLWCKVLFLRWQYWSLATEVWGFLQEGFGPTFAAPAVLPWNGTLCRDPVAGGMWWCLYCGPPVLRIWGYDMGGVGLLSTTPTTLAFFCAAEALRGCFKTWKSPKHWQRSLNPSQRPKRS